MKTGLIKRKIAHLTNETCKDVLTATSLFFVSIAMSLLVFRESLSGVFRNSIPLAGDGLLTGLYIKSVEQSDYLSLFFQNIFSAQYGWPGKLDFTSYPVGNTQEMLVIKIFMDVTGIIDPSQIIHIFSILKAAPIAIATFILARVLGIHRLFSAVIGLTFAFSTYNLVRAEGHFFLAFTWSLPLGLSAIFIAFNQVISDKSPSKKIASFGILLSLFSFMTGFYYSFFLVIFSIISMIFLFLRLNQENFGQSLLARTTDTFKQLYFPILILFIFILGLLLQTVPVLLRNMSVLKLIGLADRSVTESVIYAGTPESLLFDLHSFALRMLDRPDIIAFLNTRISWEGAQVGALSGAILIGLFFFMLFLGLSKLLVIHENKTSLAIKIDKSQIFVLIMLSTSLLLYFVSPINFTISRFLPQIRAWGRLSVVISLLSLMLLGLFLTKLKRSQLTTFSIAAIVAIVPILEYNQFRMNRPPSIALNNVTTSQNKEFESTLLDLREKYNKNCSLVNLPLYPFPEFDRVDDKNIDYGQHQLSILDYGYFRWSYGGIKATENFRVWQPLVSEFPPFARASIGDQISYGNFVGACGALVDRSYLNEGEKLELQILLANPSMCASELDGPMIDNLARFLTFEYQPNKCKSKSNPELEKLALDTLDKNLVWRVDQSSEIGFEGSYQMFTTSTAINVRLRATQSSSRSGLILRLKLASDNLTVDSSRTLTITSLENQKTQSFRIKFNTGGLGWVELPANLASGELERMTLSLSDEGMGEIGTWGIQLGKRN
jgi:hypothetical protein